MCIHCRCSADPNGNNSKQQYHGVSHRVVVQECFVSRSGCPYSCTRLNSKSKPTEHCYAVIIASQREASRRRRLSPLVHPRFESKQQDFSKHSPAHPMLLQALKNGVFGFILSKHKLVRFQNVSAGHVVLDHVWLHLNHARPHHAILA